MSKQIMRRYTIFILLFLLIAILIYKPMPNKALSESPSFSRQEIEDATNDWTFTDKEACMSGEKPNFQYPDIQSVSYFSDGKTLNITYWLSRPFSHPNLKQVASSIHAMVAITIEDLSNDNITIDQYSRQEIQDLHSGGEVSNE
jgi:hypothetical protein